MCTPVFPNTDHPTRQPLKPSKPLPETWKNCYLASFETVTLRVPISHANDDLAVTMPFDARIEHGSAIMEDQKRQKELSNVYHTSNLVPMADFPLRASGSSGEDNGHADATPRHSVSSRARTLSIASVPVESESQPVPPPIANLSYDITSVPTLADPQDLLAEIKFIQNLYKEARTRSLARRARGAEETARAIAEAKKLDEVTFGRPSTLAPAPQTKVDPPLQEEPIEPPSAFVVTFRRWKAQLQPYACGLCGSTTHASEQQQGEKDKASEQQQQGEKDNGDHAATISQQPGGTDRPQTTLIERTSTEFPGPVPQPPP
ncbi:hypothetical protein FIBSPDRAFT_583782 [Athelia psychrophila]|uniref:Uncharacterized protein n=1 Tax=Athelia psychrophila TaxID=1759441 RepID=A0A166HEY7_9AGAM|nr:hypothetical protein FIBSPDRAFT_583782 [Fibularhizoctonia sp. CBS 109695]